MFLQKDAENIDEGCEYQGNFKENGNKKDTWNQKDS